MTHFGERFTFQAGPLLLSSLHKFFLALLGLASFFIELSLALLLLLTLATQELLAEDGDTDECLLELLEVDVLRAGRLLGL